MNKLSLFLYMADIVPGLLLPILIPITAIAIVTCMMVFVGIVWCANEYLDTHDREKAESYYNRVTHHAKWIIPLFLFVSIIQSLIPSRETIYLIAGSEVGEIVVNSPEAREILDDVKTVIKQQIKGVEEKVK